MSNSTTAVAPPRTVTVLDWFVNVISVTVIVIEDVDRFVNSTCTMTWPSLRRQCDEASAVNRNSRGGILHPFARITAPVEPPMLVVRFLPG